MSIWTDPYVLASVEDHTPVRHWSLKYKDDAIRRLKDEGVRYVAFGPHTFYPSAYPFLSQTELQRDWVDPMTQLENQLLQHGRRIVRLDGEWICARYGLDWDTLNYVGQGRCLGHQVSALVLNEHICV